MSPRGAAWVGSFFGSRRVYLFLHLIICYFHSRCWRVRVPDVYGVSVQFGHVVASSVDFLRCAQRKNVGNLPRMRSILHDRHIGNVNSSSSPWFVVKVIEGSMTLWGGDITNGTSIGWSQRSTGTSSLGNRRGCVWSPPPGIASRTRGLPGSGLSKISAAYSKRILWAEVRLRFPCGELNGILLSLNFARRSNRGNPTTMSTLG